MTRRLGPILIALLFAVSSGCGGGSGQKVATEPTSTTTTAEPGKTALERAIRFALSDNRRLSVYVLWNNDIPSWAQRSTRGAALASLRAAARNRRVRGIRVRMLKGRREIKSLRLDPSYTRAIAIVLDRQRVQPSQKNGTPLGRPVNLSERARYELRRLGRSSHFVIWRVVLLQ